MRPHLIIAGIVLACVAGVWLLTGEDSEPGTATGEGTPPAGEAAPPAETPDPLPKLPRGWTSIANGAGGYAIGVPPGWSAKEAGAKTTLRSPGSAVVVSVTADRSDEALEAPLEDYASKIAASVEEAAAPSALADPPKPGPGYEAAGAEAPGSAGRIEAIVVRRPRLAAYPVLIASGRGVRPAQLDPIVNRLIGSLRGRPVTLGG